MTNTETDAPGVFTWVPEYNYVVTGDAVPQAYLAQTYKHARAQAVASIADWNHRNPTVPITLAYEKEDNK